MEIIQQSPFGVFAGVIEDADGTAVAAGTHDAQNLHVLGADTEREDLAALRFTVDVHAIEIEAEQVRQHAWQHSGKAVKMAVAVVQVVNDADVLNPLPLQCFGDRDGVLWLAAPAAVIVDAHLAAEGRGSLTDDFEPCDLLLEACLLIRLILHCDVAATAADTELRMHTVALEKFERVLGLCIERAWKPPAKQLDVVLLQCIQFVIPLRNMFRTIVIDEPLHAHLFEHRRSFFGAPFARIKRNDAPCGEIGFVEQIPSCESGDGQAGQEKGDKQDVLHDVSRWRHTLPVMLPQQPRQRLNPGDSFVDERAKASVS